MSGISDAKALVVIRKVNAGFGPRWRLDLPEEAATVVLIVDEVDRPAVEVGPFALDDVQLARLVALLDAGATVLLRDRPPFVRPDPTPAEMAEIEENAERIRTTMGERAAQEYIEERLGGSL